MSSHSCDLAHCDGTRLGHELARDFPKETARLEESLDRLRYPEDHVKPENLLVDLGLDERPKVTRDDSIHVLVIEDVWWDDDIDAPDYEWHIEHPPDCPHALGINPCWVQEEFNAVGFHDALIPYAYPREIQTFIWKTTYYLSFWSEHYPSTPNGPEEYGWGLSVSTVRSDLG